MTVNYTPQQRSSRRKLYAADAAGLGVATVGGVAHSMAKAPTPTGSSAVSRFARATKKINPKVGMGMFVGGAAASLGAQAQRNKIKQQAVGKSAAFVSAFGIKH